MKKTKSCVLLLSLIFCMLSSASWGEIPTPNLPVYIHATIGLANPSFGDVNDYLDSTEQALEDLSQDKLGWDNFGTSPSFGMELGKQVSKSAFLGVKFSYQKSTLTDSYTTSLGSLSDEPGFSVLDISVRLKFELTNAPGFFLGACGGFAHGKFTEVVRSHTFDDPALDFDFKSEYTGSGLSLGGFAGYQMAVGERAFLTGELGYKYRNLGSFDGFASSPGYEDYNGPALNNLGEEMDFDFSGISIDVGIVFLLGS